LAQVVGQPAAVAQLRDLAAMPYPCALILAGATGTGKTSAAYALAADLGCDLDANPAEFGGIWSIPSGEQTADALRAVWPQLWTMPFSSARGWKVLIVNEVEALNGKVEQLYLDKLEDLPPSTIVVFTTNALESLPARFVDRCTVIEFESDADKLTADARRLAASIWRDETGSEIPADVLTKVIDRASVAGRMSFRRIVQSLVPLIAAKGNVRT
jgi:DNA polymerase III delta prime subunit